MCPVVNFVDCSWCCSYFFDNGAGNDPSASFVKFATAARQDPQLKGLTVDIALDVIRRHADSLLTLDRWSEPADQPYGRVLQSRPIIVGVDEISKLMNLSQAAAVPEVRLAMVPCRCPRLCSQTVDFCSTSLRHHPITQLLHPFARLIFVRSRPILTSLRSSPASADAWTVIMRFGLS